MTVLEGSLAERVAELAPVLEAASDTTEDAGSLSPTIVAAMRHAELFRMWVPRAYGGLETPVGESLDVIIDLARHDGSAGWSTMIANTTALLAARLPADVAAQLFGRPDAIAAGFAQPRGRARVADGGLVVDGRWQWGSFTRHATVIGAGVSLEPEDGGGSRFVFMDPADVEWLDTWHVVGLRGTGSCDYVATGAFVPDGHWVDLTSEEAPIFDSPLYRFSFFGLLATGVAATAIGVAQAAIDAFIDLAAGKVPQGSTRTLAQRPVAQADVARAEATVRSSTCFLHDTVATAWDHASAGDAMTVEDRRLLRLAATDATQRCADAVNRLYRTAGGEAVYERCPMERLFRDVNVATQHAMVSERLYESTGRIRLGLDTDARQL